MNMIKILKNIKHAVSCKYSFWLTNKYKEKLANTDALPIITLRDKDKEPRIIVSMTTIPSRINAAAMVARIMLMQTVKPDTIYIYLGKEWFKDVELPKELVELESHGVKVVYCDDLKPHTKYFYAMKKFPEDIVITVDDDILYPYDLIETLMKSYHKYPKAVSCMRAHLIKQNVDGTLMSYNDWKPRVSGHTKPSHLLLATGVGGVLYPPHCMDEEVFNVDNIKNLSLKADDIWLKVMEWRAGTKVVKASAGIGVTLLIKDTQEINLVDCQTAHCRRGKSHFIFGGLASPIVPYRNLTQTTDGITADCRSLV